MRPNISEIYDHKQLYAQLPNLDTTLRSRDTAALEEIVEIIYAELVGFGLHEVSEFLYRTEDQKDLSECINELRKIVVQHENFYGNNHNKEKNYAIASQNILILTLTTRLMEDQEVKEDLKRSLIQNTLFDTLGLSHAYKCFPSMEYETDNVKFYTGAYDKILPRIIALSKSENPLESQWAKIRLLEIKEAIYSIESKKNMSLDVTPNIEITDEEKAFFDLSHKDREVFLFEKSLTSGLESLFKDKKIEKIFLTLMLDSRSGETKYVAERKLRVLIKSLKENPTLFNGQTFLSLFDDYIARNLSR